MRTSIVSVSEFLNILDNYKNIPEPFITFPLEYYLGENYFILYKTIMSKTYSTSVLISKRNTILLNGQEKTVEMFISDFLKNNRAIQIFKKLDEDMTVKLNTPIQE